MENKVLFPAFAITLILLIVFLLICVKYQSTTINDLSGKIESLSKKPDKKSTASKVDQQVYLDGTFGAVPDIGIIDRGE